MLDVFKYQDANCFLEFSNTKDIIDDHPTRMFEPLTKGENEQNKMCRYNK